MSVLTLKVDEVMRTLSAESANPFVVHDKEIDIVRFAINSGFADIVLDGQVALRVMYQRPGETEVRAQTLTYYDTDGLHNYYDWQLSQSDLAKNGSLMVALCILDISGGEVSEWHTTPCAVRVLPTIHTDDSDEGDDTITPTVKERVAVLESMIQRVASGAPIVVSSTSAMTDTSQIYVLSTNGQWYYHNGSSWVAGGTYGAVATDTTLTQSGAPADAKAVGDEITAIKADLNKFADSRNLFLGAKFTSEKYYYGVEQSASTLGYFIIPVVSGNTYTFGCSVRFLSSASEGIDNAGHPEGYQYTPDFTGDLYVTVYLNESDKYAMCLSEYDVSEIGTVQNPRLAQGLLAQASGNSKTLAMSQAGTTQAVKEIAVMLDGEGQVTPGNIEGVTVSGGNVLEDAERLYCTQLNTSTTDGYVNISNGTAIIQTTGSYCSFLIAVKPNTHYTANHSIRFAVLLKNLSSEGTTPVKYSTVVGSALANISSFDTGEADHIIVSWNYNSFPINNFVISEGNTPTTDKTITLPDWWTGGSTPTVTEKPKYASITGSLSSGESLVLPLTRNNLRKGERVVFEGNITSFVSLKIGLVHTAPVTDSIGRNIFLIDGTNISYYKNPTSTPVTVPHGMTITNNIQIVWEMSAVATCKITLISDGNIFSHEFSGFVRQMVGFPFVLSVNAALTDCKLTWTCIDLCKDIWMFGDSYFAYSEARWTYYLHQYGYDNNCLLDGFPGEGGVNGKVAFSNLLQFGTPKFAVWCLGMNDTTDSESAPATNWVTNRDSFLQYCRNNNVTPIFGTIPTVPTINHEQKNAWIRSSGYRYIDFAKAVGASASGAWFSGMLSSDGIHPTEQGARALFAQVLLDFPEIMVDNLT